MKRIFFLVFLLIPVLAFGQEESFFSLNDGGLIWQKVYESNASPESVSRGLMSSGYFSDIKSAEGLVTAEMSGVHLLYKDLGYKRMRLPLYVVNDTYSAFVMVQIKDGRYRVTLSRILAHNSSFGDCHLDEFAVSDGEIDAKFLVQAGRIAGYTFNSLLSNLGINDEDDDW